MTSPRTPLGSLLGLAMGGVLADAFGWRKAFLVCAVPGVIVAALCALTLREPRKTLKRMVEERQVQLATFSETFRYLRGKRAFWWLASGAGVRAFLGYGHAPEDPHAKDELNEDLLDNVHLAGARFERMLKRLAG